MKVKEVLVDKIINREDTYIRISHAEFVDEAEEKIKFVVDYCSSCEDMDIHDFDEYEVDMVLYKALNNGLQINVVPPDEEEDGEMNKEAKEIFDSFIENTATDIGYKIVIKSEKGESTPTTDVCFDPGDAPKALVYWIVAKEMVRWADAISKKMEEKAMEELLDTEEGYEDAKNMDEIILGFAQGALKENE